MTKHVVVTGANKGIGLNFCKQYSAQGYRVTAVVRTPSEELQALDVKVISDIDVSNAGDVATLANYLHGDKIDILINNAGIFHNETLADMDFAAIEKQISVNSIAPIRITHALQQNLGIDAKVAMITSRMGSITDNGSGGYIGYRMSKAALNAASVSLAHELKDKKIAVGLFHPGFVQTQMVNFAGDISPETAAERLIKRIDELNLSNTGGFWHSNGETLPW
ncbi:MULTISPECIES: SDR family oxidoreductase [unclassified Pseudoalteromonas]|uniref:SDR family oxidoreductase n=1 Tax=Pseudoalteromonas TaxID=53246 RepID=UPI000C8EC889|nr:MULTISPECIES: SDR family oxidoreductase [unclassified Pseudoalteromonas]MAD05355.1 short-chain dehydrogenase [Pseudoalteromonas sp.]MCP4585505.1 SDR family oxidoreductase [Pseudoalteromonas sp.]QLE08181.1 SDR family oxidoreductase [Pseudoalteromonas shioyasakiensis]RZD20998.1 SDR family oxidoreductase [Pseudoalteromonas sp. MEBiC 03485]|tara:strand:- start:30001 stop:30666 length:666 start_codon:yes stop_codon:yes gene_type:complete